jgi:hypothetical protein
MEFFGGPLATFLPGDRLECDRKQLHGRMEIIIDWYRIQFFWLAAAMPGGRLDGELLSCLFTCSCPDPRYLLLR